MGRIDPGMELRPHITCILCDPLPEQRHSGFTFQHRIIDHMNWPHASAVQIPLPFGKSFEALDVVAGAGKGLVPVKFLSLFHEERETLAEFRRKNNEVLLVGLADERAVMI